MPTGLDSSLKMLCLCQLMPCTRNCLALTLPLVVVLLLLFLSLLEVSISIAVATLEPGTLRLIFQGLPFGAQRQTFG